MSTTSEEKDEYIEKVLKEINDETSYQKLLERLDSTKFSPIRLYANFHRSILNEDSSDISLREYLKAYNEINKFLESLGSVFYFVVSDIKDKIGILNGYLTSNSNSYETILKTVDHEKTNNIYRQRINASRNILRLHRALLFIYKFLERIFNSSNQDKPSYLCSEVYETTLGKHHSWLVRQSARMGMFSLPKREVFLVLMCQDQNDLKYYPIFLKKLEHVYNITQKILEKYQFLDLP